MTRFFTGEIDMRTRLLRDEWRDAIDRLRDPSRK
jgi:hypothetical protein